MSMNWHSGTRNMTAAALALAVATVMLLIFRGPVSIVSAPVIPAVIVLATRKSRPAHTILLAAGLLTVTLVFFQTQLLFVTGYLCLALALKLLLMPANMKVRLRPLPVLLFLLITGIVLFAGIWLTERLFLVPLHQMMLRLAGHNPLRYAAIILAESLLICTINVTLLKIFTARTAAAG